MDNKPLVKAEYTVHSKPLVNVENTWKLNRWLKQKNVDFEPLVNVENSCTGIRCSMRRVLFVNCFLK